jgi:hypothetical protein
MARYALIVGIAKYDRLPSLTKPHTDAEAIAQLLSQYGDFQEIRRLPTAWNTEKNSYEVAYKPLTGKDLGQTLRQFLLEQADKSEAIIYFSGHGVSVEDNLGRRKGYLVTSDCTLETLDTRGISLDSLNQLIEESNLSSLVVLLDCCHAGYALERNLVKQTFTAFSAQKDYYLIAACRGFEKAYEGEETEPYSIFTKAVIDGLLPENADKKGNVSIDRLFDYVGSELKESGQEPLRIGWGRSITLVAYPVGSQASTKAPQPPQSSIPVSEPVEKSPITSEEPQTTPTTITNNTLNILGSNITNLSGSGQIKYNESSNKT